MIEISISQTAILIGMLQEAVGIIYKERTKAQITQRQTKNWSNNNVV